MASHVNTPPHKQGATRGRALCDLENTLGKDKMAEFGITEPLNWRFRDFNDIDLPPCNHPLLAYTPGSTGPFWHAPAPGVMKFRQAFDLGLRLASYLLDTDEVLSFYTKASEGNFITTGTGANRRVHVEDVNMTPQLIKRTKDYIKSRLFMQRLHFSMEGHNEHFTRFGQVLKDTGNLAATGSIKKNLEMWEATTFKVGIAFHPDYAAYAAKYHPLIAGQSLATRSEHLRINFDFAVVLLHEICHIFEYIRSPFANNRPADDFSDLGSIHMDQLKKSDEWGDGFEQTLFGGYHAPGKSTDIRLPKDGLCLLRELTDGDFIVQIVPMDRLQYWFSLKHLKERFEEGKEWPDEVDPMIMMYSPTLGRF
ncbi:hypothetical protein BT63DRAFT_413403 [Microthyrium microscopicum]|uniref:Uncharacterized protein n=1 Tax=Microthyrium microscopicum TaxID=703497 RepID=A0A6A6UCT1_9PEZI|nr:hypothetical protein BT63DRAFT_413403 [Microthyrium microscopicum]